MVGNFRHRLVRSICYNMGLVILGFSVDVLVRSQLESNFALSAACLNTCHPVAVVAGSPQRSGVGLPEWSSNTGAA